MTKENNMRRFLKMCLALGILHTMAEKEGSIDPEILRMFEESKARFVIVV